MTTVTAIGDLRAALPDLGAEARARATEFEALRKLAPDFADKLKQSGAFRLLVPGDARGLGGSLPEWLEIVMALAEADASTGWVTAHASICAGVIYASADHNELRGKTDRYTQKPLLEHPSTQRSLEAAEGLWYACRAGMREALAAMWEFALRGEPAPADARVNARVAAVTAVQKGRGDRPSRLRRGRRERRAPDRRHAAVAARGKLSGASHCGEPALLRADRTGAMRDRQAELSNLAEETL